MRFSSSFQKKKRAASQQKLTKKSLIMAPYYDMCKAAIKALKDRNGSSGAAIKKVSDLFMVIIIFSLT